MIDSIDDGSSGTEYVGMIIKWFVILYVDVLLAFIRKSCVFTEIINRL